MNDRNRELKPFVPQPDDDMIVCRCEEITKGEIRRAKPGMPSVFPSISRA